MPLAAVLFLGILTMWVPQRWALAAFQLALFALAAARIALRLRGGRGIAPHPASWALGAAIAWGLLQTAAGWTVDRFRTLDQVLNWTANLAAFALAVETAAEPAGRERFLNAVLAFGCVLSVAAMLTVFSSPPGVVAWRFDLGTGAPTLGPFVYRNQYAAFVEAILPLAVVRALLDRARGWLYAGAAALLFASVVAAASRTGAILCAAEMALVTVLARMRGLVSTRRLARVAVAGGAAIAAFAVAAGWDFLWSRFQEPQPYALRANLLRSSLAMTTDRPLAGWGLGTWPQVYPGYALYDDGSFVNQAHSDWAQWAAEGGLPFFALMLALAAAGVRPALRSLWGLGIMAVFVHGLVDYPMQQRPALAAFFFALLGAVLARDARPKPLGREGV
jgi:hypothetical protein